MILHFQKMWILIVAGGDGTVSMVGTHLVGKNASLGIVPLGTGNLLAKALHIPQDIEQALELIVSKNPNKVCIDTFKLDERNFLLNISVGLSPKLMDSVHSHQKQRMGVFAYLIYFFQQVLGLKLHKVLSIATNVNFPSWHPRFLLLTSVPQA